MQTTERSIGNGQVKKSPRNKQFVMLKHDITYGKHYLVNQTTGHARQVNAVGNGGIKYTQGTSGFANYNQRERRAEQLNNQNMSVAQNIVDKPIRHDAEVIPALLEAMNLGNFLPPYKQTSVSPKDFSGSIAKAGHFIRNDTFQKKRRSTNNANQIHYTSDINSLMRMPAHQRHITVYNKPLPGAFDKLPKFYQRKSQFPNVETTRQEINDRVQGRRSQKSFSPYKEEPARSKTQMTSIAKPGLTGSGSATRLNNQSFGELNKSGYTNKRNLQDQNNSPQRKLLGSIDKQSINNNSNTDINMIKQAYDQKVNSGVKSRSRSVMQEKSGLTHRSQSISTHPANMIRKNLDNQGASTSKLADTKNKLNLKKNLVEACKTKYAYGQGPKMIMGQSSSRNQLSIKGGSEMWQNGSVEATNFSKQGMQSQMTSARQSVGGQFGQSTQQQSSWARKSMGSDNGSQRSSSPIGGVHTTYGDLRTQKHNDSKLGAYNQLKKHDVRQGTLKSFMGRSQSRSYMSIEGGEDSDESENEQQLKNRPSFAKIGLQRSVDSRSSLGKSSIQSPVKPIAGFAGARKTSQQTTAGLNDSLFDTSNRDRTTNSSRKKWGADKTMKIGGKNLMDFQNSRQSNGSFAGTSVNHDYAMQKFLDQEDFAQRKRLQDMIDDQDHDFPFSHGIRMDMKSINKQPLRQNIRNRQAFDETALKTEQKQAPTRMQLLPIQNESYQIDKQYRGITEGKFQMDPQRNSVIKHAGEHYTKEYKDLVGRNEPLRVQMARQKALDFKKLNAVKKNRVLGEVETKVVMAKRDREFKKQLIKDLHKTWNREPSQRAGEHKIQLQTSPRNGLF